jgi:hypothetical protein
MIGLRATTRAQRTDPTTHAHAPSCVRAYTAPRRGCFCWALGPARPPRSSRQKTCTRVSFQTDATDLQAERFAAGGALGTDTVCPACTAHTLSLDVQPCVQHTVIKIERPEPHTRESRATATEPGEPSPVTSLERSPRPTRGVSLRPQRYCSMGGGSRAWVDAGRYA